MVDDERSPVVGRLHLSGIVRAAPEARPAARARRQAPRRLAVRCPIYARVFDPRWVAEQMPDAEIRRQRAAFRQGLVRAGLAASVLLATLGALAAKATASARSARIAQRQALESAGSLRVALADKTRLLAQLLHSRGRPE